MIFSAEHLPKTSSSHICSQTHDLSTFSSDFCQYLQMSSNAKRLHDRPSFVTL
jgi:hypothetical protein